MNGDPIAKRFMRSIEHLIEKVERVSWDSELQGAQLIQENVRQNEQQQPPRSEDPSREGGGQQLDSGSDGVS